MSRNQHFQAKKSAESIASSRYAGAATQRGGVDSPSRVHREEN
jgi:hypothetical protein